jgi:hypothetical protein
MVAGGVGAGLAACGAGWAAARELVRTIAAQKICVGVLRKLVPLSRVQIAYGWERWGDWLRTKIFGRKQPDT